MNDFTDIHCKAMVNLGIMLKLEEKTTLGCIGDLKSFNTFHIQFQIKKRLGVWTRYAYRYYAFL